MMGLKGCVTTLGAPGTAHIFQVPLLMLFLSIPWPNKGQVQSSEVQRPYHFDHLNSLQTRFSWITFKPSLLRSFTHISRKHCRFVFFCLAHCWIGLSTFIRPMFPTNASASWDPVVPENMSKKKSANGFSFEEDSHLVVVELVLQPAVFLLLFREALLSFLSPHLSGQLRADSGWHDVFHKNLTWLVWLVWFGLKFEVWKWLGKKHVGFWLLMSSPTSSRTFSSLSFMSCLIRPIFWNKTANCSKPTNKA